MDTTSCPDARTTNTTFFSHMVTNATFSPFFLHVKRLCSEVGSFLLAGRGQRWARSRVGQVRVKGGPGIVITEVQRIPGTVWGGEEEHTCTPEHSPPPPAPPGVVTAVQYT